MMKNNANPNAKEHENKNIVRLQIFISPSCCPGGACAPGLADPTSKMVTIVQEIMKQYNGRVTGEVINVLHPLVKTQHQDVIKHIRKHGLRRTLPLLKIDGAIIVEGENFSRELIVDAVRERVQV